MWKYCSLFIYYFYGDYWCLFDCMDLECYCLYDLCDYLMEMYLMVGFGLGRIDFLCLLFDCFMLIIDVDFDCWLVDIEVEYRQCLQIIIVVDQVGLNCVYQVLYFFLDYFVLGSWIW